MFIGFKNDIAILILNDWLYQYNAKPLSAE